MYVCVNVGMYTFMYDMHACMIYLYVCIYACMYVWMDGCRLVYIQTHIYYMHVLMYTLIDVCIHILFCVHEYVHIITYVYICVCLHIFVHACMHLCMYCISSCIHACS